MTTDKDKIDPKLRAEMDRIERTGESDRTIPIIIEHASDRRVADEAEAGDLSALDERVRAGQSALRARLSKMGAKDVQQMTLANAIAARLTPAQIRELASDRDVKRILWNAAERVTA
jgi:hypothetical protein